MDQWIILTFLFSNLAWRDIIALHVCYWVGTAGTLNLLTVANLPY